MSFGPFLELPQCAPESADVLLLPLPYEGTVSYGQGTARGPEAIWQASAQIELWDEQLDFDLDRLRYHTAEPVVPEANEQPEIYLARVEHAARALHLAGGLVVGIGGEHSLTPPLVSAAQGERPFDELTVVQFDAHSDLRESFDGTPHSHACAMRSLVERGARVIAIGIRSAERAEFQYGVSSGRVETFTAQRLAEEPDLSRSLNERLAELAGRVYLTIDVDVMDVAFSPGTGTPQPGGLAWWPMLGLLKSLLHQRADLELIGCDVVETAPQPGTRVNEFTSARLLAKLIAYRFHGQH
ncbi:MAG: agmatinase [Pirellulales bacterium]